jgi:nitrous oxidase accessory protein NosD/N-acetylneuraminic acid mutarotase
VSRDSTRGWVLVKRKASSLMFILILTTTFFATALLSVKGGARTIVVPDDYASVQSAINNAANGDTVFVKSGTYNESLLISKSIRLIGENANTTILTYPTLYPPEVYLFPPSTTEIGITAKNFEISNFTIENKNANGVTIIAMVNGSRITRNIIGFPGLQVIGSNNTVIQNIILSGYPAGLSVQGSSNLIEENVMTDSNIDIQGDSNVITRNNARDIALGRTYAPLQGGGRSSSGNIVFGNRIGSLGTDNGTNNIFYENKIETVGIGSLAKNSTFYHNNFLGNLEHVHNYNSNDAGNSWDNGKEGNYWNDYYGADVDGDGIGDSPYIIDASNQDIYPLIHPWGGAPDTNINVTENFWITKEPMQQARSGLSAAAVNGKIYAIGGSTESGPNSLGSWTIGAHVGTNEEYNPETDTWSYKASMPTPRVLFATAVYQNKIYCIGGRTVVNGVSESYNGTNEVYDTTSDTWETKKSMPTARSWLSASVVNGKIYVIGGDPRTTHDEVYDPTHNEVYDPATDTWTTKASIPALPYDGWFHVSAVVDNKIYVIGERLRIYDTETDKWSEGSSPPSGIFPLSSVSTGSVAVVTAGISAPKRIYVVGETNLVYNPYNDSWTRGAEVHRKRYGYGVAVLDDSIYAIGGQLFRAFTDDFVSVAWNDQYIPFGYGAVPPVIHDTQPFPTVPVAVASVVASITIVGTGLLVYFKKRKHQSSRFYNVTDKD